LAFLSFAQVDARGSVNVSLFNGRIIGVGGFINIAQNAKKVIFSGTFTTGGLDIVWENGMTHIRKEGKFHKFNERIEQVSYSGPYAHELGQQAWYVTERAVFRRGLEGLELMEIAPGLDLERDILAQMDFRPRISDDLKEMDRRLFLDKPMGLAADLAGRAPCRVPARLRK
jgi:propionate CoA-transferase